MQQLAVSLLNIYIDVSDTELENTHLELGTTFSCSSILC